MPNKAKNEPSQLMGGHMRSILLAVTLIVLPSMELKSQQDQMGQPYRPSYELYRTDDLVRQGDVSYTGDLGLSIPLLTVPGKHGHDFQITLTYSSSITQRQTASWVGLGWNLEVGHVERTVLGRFDDQAEGGGGHGGGDAEKAGWIRGNSGYPIEDRDQNDLYTLYVDGGAEELLAFPEPVYSRAQFVPMRYRPSWNMYGYYSSNPILMNFQLLREDGARYVFSYAEIGSVGYPSMMQLRNTAGDIVFLYPNKWPLTTIYYPDGATTSIAYSVSSTSGYTTDKYGAAFVDRNNTIEPTNNVFGGIGLGWPSTDPFGTVSYRYARPDTIATDTHYAVFVHSTPAVTNPSAPEQDKYERTCEKRKLDEIIVYDKQTGLELKRAKFFYATTNNPQEAYFETDPTVPSAEWQGERLNNDQLTLDSVRVQSGPNPESNDDKMPAYVFTYMQNPKVDWVHQTKYPRLYDDDYFPGYHTKSVFGTAWRLKSVTLPTGATIDYQYETLNVDYTVTVDPEDRTPPLQQYPWSYKLEPRCRLKTRTVTDPLGVRQMWAYSYGTPVLDPPSRPAGLNYVPRAYQENPDNQEDFYRYFKGCTIGHRWVQVTNPDGSWQRSNYTSSYKKADADPKESQPDVIITVNDPGFDDQYTTGIISNAAKRGIVWKSETLSDTTVYSYTYVEKGNILERIEYFYFGWPGTMYHQVKEFCYWARLDTVRHWMDGVYSFDCYSYWPGNDLPFCVYEGLPDVARVTTNLYANDEYPGMSQLNMKSQLYQVSVSKGTAASKSSLTTWAQFGSLWLPKEEWELSVGPGSNAIKTLTYDLYDSRGNLLQTTDPYGVINKFYYGTNTNQFENSGLGYAKLTGIDKDYAGEGEGAIRIGYKYDHYGQVTEEKDVHNGDAKTFDYDKLGRLKAVYGPHSEKITDFGYAYSGGALSASNPNSITSKAYRTATEFTEKKSFYDGLGLEIQTQHRIGTEDIIRNSEYSKMRQVESVSRPYQKDVTHNYTSPTLVANWSFENDPLGSGIPSGWYSSGQPNEIVTDGYLGRKAVKVVHQDGTNSSLSTDIGTLLARKTFTARVKFKAAVGTKGQLFFGDAGGPDPYDNCQTAYVDGNGDWQDIVITLTMSHDDQMSVFLYGDKDYGWNGAYVIYDAVIVEEGDRPYSRTEYTADVPPRVMHQHGAGSVFQDESLHHYLKYYYGTNSTNEIGDGAPVGSYHKTTTVNENAAQVKTLEFKNRLGYLAATQVDSEVMRLTTKFQTDGEGKVLVSTDPNGLVSTYLYDGRGRLVQKVSPDAGTTQYLHDLNGNTRLVKDANGNFIYYKYDNLNNVTEVGQYTGASSDFTQENANNRAFPTSNRVLDRSFMYGEQLLGQENTAGRLSRSISYRSGTSGITTYYSYDDFGRVAWIRHSGWNGDKKIQYDYDFQGIVTRKIFTDFGNASNNLTTFYEYDQLGRLFRVYTGQDPAGVGKVKDAEFTYLPTGSIGQLKLGVASAQTVDYSYNDRDWLVEINDVDTVGLDRFAESIHYHDGILESSSLYNGDIAAVRFYNAGIATAPYIGYRLTYDNANRLTAAQTYLKTTTWNSSNNHRLTQVDYQPNGNIDTLGRTNASGIETELLSYSYHAGSNRLDTVYNVALSDIDTYNYDANGNVTSDTHRGLSGFVYDLHNLPTSIQKTGAPTISYWYDTSGNRIRKQQGTLDEIYVVGADGQTEAIYQNGELLFWNINANGQTIGKISPF